MLAGRVAWVAGAYIVGTFPSTWVVARLRGASGTLSRARGNTSTGDAHVLLDRELGKAWGGAAAALDVLKGFGYALAARFAGALAPRWLAAVGVALVAGHCFPPYLRRLAGRGLSCASGVMLALVPIAMVVAGVIIVVGYALRTTGLASTIGFASTPAVTAALGRPAPLVAMTAAIFVLVVLRRMPGASEPARALGWPMALMRRAIFDDDGPVAR